MRAEVYRKTLEQMKDLAFNEDVCLGKDRVRAKIITKRWEWP